MPRKSKLVKKRKRSPRSYKLARRKHSIAFRRGRRNVRRLYRRRGRRLRTSRAYRLQSKVGIKFSLNLSPMEFALFPYYDINNLLANCVFAKLNPLTPIWVHDNGQNHGFEYWNENYKDYLSSFISTLLSCPSTSIMSLSNQLFDGSNSKYHKYRNALCAYAFNPCLSTLNCGNRFNQYINEYEKFKYVGLKVRYTPSKSSFNSSVPVNKWTFNSTASVPSHYNEAYYQLNTYMGTTVPNYQIGLGGNINQQALTNDEEIPENALLPSQFGEDPLAVKATINVTVVPQPQYRLWVNFDKYPFADIVLPINYSGTLRDQNSWNDVMNAVQQSRGSRIWKDYQYATHSRFKYRSVFDCDSGIDNEAISCLLDYKTTKSFSLLKPFKFFVRPYHVDVKSESSGGAPSRMQIQQQLSLVAQNYTVPGGDQQISTKRFGYQLMPHFTPPGYFLPRYPEFATQNQALLIDDNFTKLVMNFNDKNYLNPVLFSYFFTRDDLNMGQYENLAGVFSSLNTDVEPKDFPAEVRERFWTYFSFKSKSNFNHIGRFKLTFYVRFKNRSNQNTYTTLQLDTANSGKQQDITYPISYYADIPEAPIDNPDSPIEDVNQ